MHLHTSISQYNSRMTNSVPKLEKYIISCELFKNYCLDVIYAKYQPVQTAAAKIRCEHLFLIGKRNCV